MRPDHVLVVRWDDRLPGARRFFTADPFGDRLELLERPGLASLLAPGKDAERTER